MMEQLTVPDNLDSLKAIADYIMAAAVAAGLDNKTSYKLRLAVDEIATNIIIYGYQEAGRSGVLDLQAEIDEYALTILVEDTGLPYDSTATPLPDDLDQPLEQRKTGGLGVYLAIHGVDKFIYERIGERNRHIFVVHRSRVMERLTVPDNLDSLKAIAEYVIAAATAADLDKKASYQLRLAVDEIATNIITHGYQEAGRSGVLNLQAEFNKYALTISVEDTGVPFDSTLTPTPDNLDQPLEEREPGGLGVYIAMHGVDKFIYERVGERNRHIFVMNRE